MATNPVVIDQPIAPAARPSRKSRAARGDTWFAFWLVLPAILVVIGVSIYPVAYAIWTSLHMINPAMGMNAWVGLDNYRNVFMQQEFRTAAWVTFRFAASVTVSPSAHRQSGFTAIAIVVVSSGAGLRSFPFAAVYGATKSAQRGFAEALRHELSGTGVSVTVVYPGEVESHLHDHAQRLPDWNQRTRGEIAPVGPLAEAIVKAVEDDERAVYYPREVRMLRIAHGISPKLADRMLRRLRGGTAAPRID